MPQPSDRTSRIRALLTEAFEPTHLEIIDDSARHAGHAGAAPGGETHYNIEITSTAFEGLSRVQIQRAVMLALQAEFDSGLHALSLKAKMP
ncbi:BolA family protein [Hyphomonas johnsonii]|uniref:BolA family protein n=1 Tax=Hyphomonas johnsonii MHS-2 TaxID=1280950 RepID=A0A059FMM2_9PROT|nr:BolA family protein [Hyphomonas johnsonii]KCZ91713.1 BolA family protein [Hyphomonas johnsonii MHS-2]